jgi:hypothetical protein
MNGNIKVKIKTVLQNLPNTASSGHDPVLSGKMMARHLDWVRRIPQRACGAGRTGFRPHLRGSSPNPRNPVRTSEQENAGQAADSASGGFIRQVPLVVELVETLAGTPQKACGAGRLPSGASKFLLSTRC